MPDLIGAVPGATIARLPTPDIPYARLHRQIDYCPNHESQRWEVFFYRYSTTDQLVVDRALSEICLTSSLYCFVGPVPERCKHITYPYCVCRETPNAA